VHLSLSVLAWTSVNVQSRRCDANRAWPFCSSDCRNSIHRSCSSWSDMLLRFWLVNASWCSGVANAALSGLTFGRYGVSSTSFANFSFQLESLITGKDSSSSAVGGIDAVSLLGEGASVVLTAVRGSRRVPNSFFLSLPAKAEQLVLLWQGVLQVRYCLWVPWAWRAEFQVGAGVRGQIWYFVRLRW